MSLEPHWWCDG